MDFLTGFLKSKIAAISTNQVAHALYIKMHLKLKNAYQGNFCTLIAILS